MPFSIAIIGAGWYGCHLAASLSAIGMDITVFDRNSRPLNDASGNNQFRLHMGFHYARHYNTRMQSRDGFMRFMERYPSLTGPVSKNIYAVPTQESWIDFLTYRLIMTSSGIEFTETGDPGYHLQNIEGYIITEERVLYIERARAYFKQLLGDRLVLDQEIESVSEADDGIYINGTRYDYLIDATWGHFVKPPMEIFYEPTILLYYEAKEVFPALTLVDGPLCSIYPTEDPSIYTLSSVPHTPLGRYSTSKEARDVKGTFDKDFVARKVRAMEEQISRYVPYFRDCFKYAAPQFSIKTKPFGSYDDRSCYVFKQGRKFSVMSGKIDTVFFATERILSMLESSGETELSSISSLLRQEIGLSSDHR